MAEPLMAEPVMVQSLQVTEHGEGVRFGVHVRPRSSRRKVTGVREGALSVALMAPPVAGEANAELIKLLAKTLGVRRSDVTIQVGATGRRKVVAIHGIGREALLQRLAELW